MVRLLTTNLLNTLQMYLQLILLDAFLVQGSQFLMYISNPPYMDIMDALGFRQLQILFILSLVFCFATEVQATDIASETR